MKSFTLFIIITLFTAPLFALSDEEEAIVMMEDLITATKKKLEEERQVLQLLRLFKEVKKSFIENSSSPKLAGQLVKCAKLLQNEINKSYLFPLFSDSFREELTFYCTLGNDQIQK